VPKATLHSPSTCLLFALLALAMGGSTPVLAVDLEQLRLGKHDQHTRLVFDLSGPATPKLQRMGPSSYQLRLPNTRWQARKLHARTGLVRNVTPTPASAKSSDLHLNIRLSSNAHAAMQVLTSPARVVLDLTRIAEQREYVVVIDAGHGGRAPGAVGKGGTLEKTVVLNICKQLKTALDERPGIRAVMTRSKDQTLSLGQRVDIARDTQADLFISVHADALDDRSVRGGSVYVLSNTGAEHAARRWAGGGSSKTTNTQNLAGIDLSKRDAAVANVIYDLVQTDTLERSSLLAEDVLTYMQDEGRVRFDKVRLANLGVLKAPDIPSILVETAFISNVQDEALLKSSKGQRTLARAIARGVSEFIERPSEMARVRSGDDTTTQLAASSADLPLAPRYRHYSVARGDTLYSLAKRFGVTVKSLTQINRIKNNVIKQGMTLRVPGAPALVAAGN